MEAYNLDYLHRDISLKEEDIQSVPESGRADEACAAIADKEYIKKQFRGVSFAELKNAAQAMFDNPEIRSRKDALMFFIWFAALNIKEQRYEYHGECKTKVCADGFVWLLVPEKRAPELFNAEVFTLYRLYPDDSESAIETIEDLEKAIEQGDQIGIEVGFISTIASAARMRR